MIERDSFTPMGGGGGAYNNFVLVVTLVFETDFRGEENVQPKEVTKKKSLL